MVVNFDDLIEFKGEQGLHLSNVYIQCDDILHDMFIHSFSFSYCYSKLNLSLIDSKLFNCEFQLFVSVL